MSLDQLKFTKEHEWASMDGGIATVGITEYAQKQLGDVVFVELPVLHRNLIQGEAFGVVESVKAVSDLFSPLTGEIIEVNQALVDSPQLINHDPYHEGWIIKMRVLNPGEFDQLMSKGEYDGHFQSGQK